MSIKPFAPFVILRAHGESQTSGGLFIPSDEVVDRKSLALMEVVALPEDSILSVGATVFVVPAVGHKVTVDGEPCLAIKFEDIVAVVTP